MQSFEELLQTWRDAEAGRDVSALDRLLTADFRGDGPLGFVLDKEGWLDRNRRGHLNIDRLEWALADVRVLNGTAVATGTLCQSARYRDQDRSGVVACTVVAVRREGLWRIVNVQIGRPREPKSATWSMFRAGTGATLQAKGDPMTSLTSSAPLTGPAAATGPLVVSEANPRYFAAGDRIVYLTGSHIWNNLHDGMGPGSACSDEPEVFDYDAYLQFLQDRGHNFIRLWRWEQFQSQAAGGSYHLCMAPQPWPRTGAGVARDSKPKFDLSQFDPEFFDRLRERVIAAGNAGMYVAVMLFEGWGLHLSPLPDNVEGHPFHARNNINGIGIGSIVDYQVLPLDRRIQSIQEAYIRKVIDTVHDLPNVLYEVANESSGAEAVSVELPDGFSIPTPIGDSTQWQYWVIDTVKGHEREKGYDTHPIGMTMQFPVPDQSRVNDPLLNSAAEWISPGFDDGTVPFPPGRWFTDPPANDGRKVMISDTDHFAPGMGDALWAWKAFLRGQNPILMDFGLIAGMTPSDDAAYAQFEPARYAMGDTLRYAQRINLAQMEPRGDLTSTGYALASPGGEYLVLQPNSEAFTVQLEPGDYSVEWFSVGAREAVGTGTVNAVGTDTPTSFTAPSAASGPVVLYLVRRPR